MKGNDNRRFEEVGRLVFFESASVAPRTIGGASEARNEFMCAVGQRRRRALVYSPLVTLQR